jgi:DNA invertase Pin-like site-specific DNA recombinase
MSRRKDPGTRQRLRCAIYTRKSTEEGLDQDFNSLDAQYDACAAYVASQRHEGWMLLPARYDDGGFTGGNMERPGLQRLLADVRAGRVDVIVVYKVDRLTRSLTDFAKIVEVLDGAGASFVSITQSFNTTTSMGRLTLNVLLSFAQFEREVISERVRDKVAASKARGMWMGGVVPLGYDVRERKLFINEAEAETVRHIYRRYLELGSVRGLITDLSSTGIRTKRKHGKDGTIRGGAPFSRGALYHLLKNRLYRGEISYRDKVYPGEHQAIVDADLFDTVQQRLEQNAADRRSGNAAAYPSLLTGMIRDGEGRPMSPTHSNKGGQRYRYYTSNSAAEDRSTIIRVPALKVEAAVKAAVAEVLRRGDAIRDNASSMSGSILDAALTMVGRLPQQVDAADSQTARKILRRLDLRLTCSPPTMQASISRSALLSAVGLPADPENDARVEVAIAMQVLHRGSRSRMIFQAPQHEQSNRDPKLIELVQRAFRARNQLLGGAAQLLSPRHKHALTREARLSYLAPDLIEAILAGRQPIELGARRLHRIGALPHSWSEQRKMLGLS